VGTKRILVVDDRGELRESVHLALQPFELLAEFLEPSADVLSRLSQSAERYSLLLVNLEPALDHWPGLVDQIRHRYPHLPLLFVAASENPGNQNQFRNHLILSKPFCREAFLLAIRNVMGPLPGDQGSRELSGMAGELPLAGTWSQRIESMLHRIGASDVPVLLQGETGVGKEVIARRLHALSPRASRPFVKLNCAALPSELVESELFGYERGAFTGAFKSTPGKFEMAHKGTILLDEIGDMDHRLQAKLLQVLQDHEFYRLGSHEPSTVDVRVMAASHCDFEKAIESKKFREDLYYRLNIVDLKIPPLRERRSEILPLCDVFLERHATAEWPKLEIEAILRQVLLEYHWPGNVRELENVMRKYLVIRNPSALAGEIRQKTVKSKTVYVPADELTPRRRASDWAGWKPELAEMPEPPVERSMAGQGMASVQELPRPSLVPRPLNRLGSENLSTLSGVNDAKKRAEADAILQALHSSMWNRKRAAAILNVDYKSLLYKMKKLGIGEKSTVAYG
jgi:two-component system response regulator AtoC